MNTDLPESWPDGAVFTIGHSTLPIERFIGTLKSFGIAHLADVRTVPRSRYNPQFNTDDLAASLKGAGIAYTHMKSLGGLRHPHKESSNGGWHNDGFRGYADYMATDEFLQALGQLIEMSRNSRTAVMCAESVPWRCHRSLVADALGVRGIPVVEIMPEGAWRMHKLTPFARVEGTRITYPPEQASLF